MKGAETQGGTTDPIARAGEGTTVRILQRRCTRCGARLEDIRHAYSNDLVAIRCRGGCRERAQPESWQKGR